MQNSILAIAKIVSCDTVEYSRRTTDRNLWHKWSTCTIIASFTWHVESFTHKSIGYFIDAIELSILTERLAVGIPSEASRSCTSQDRLSVWKRLENIRRYGEKKTFIKVADVLISLGVILSKMLRVKDPVVVELHFDDKKGFVRRSD